MGDWIQMDIKLFKMFLKYLFSFCFFTVILIAVFIITFIFGLNNKIILPANYGEKEIIKNGNAIKLSEPFDETLIPHTCKYGLFDKENNYLKGNFDEEIIEDAKLFLKDSKLANKWYFLIERPKERCVIQYDLSAHFSSPFLDKLFPHLEILIIGLFLIFFIILTILIAFLFGKKLKKELSPLLFATQKIKNQELDFEISYSKIKEFNEVLISMDEMKIALADSLKSEWEAEQKRKTHISALAHDIKTPLTVIKGNAELLKEENVSKEIYEHANNIDKSTDRIEQYVKLLIEATKSENGLNLNLSSIVLKDFVFEIISQARSLCKTKNITLIEKVSDMPEIIVADKEELLRAILNIILNAVDYSFNEGKIYLKFYTFEDSFLITVEDFGRGFTESALKNAKKQFFTEKFERSGSHYGMGMYITDTIIENHGGKLDISNKVDSKGAVVTISIPLK